jgi:hypothetical protein
METSEKNNKREDRKDKLLNRSFEKEKVIKCRLLEKGSSQNIIN